MDTSASPGCTSAPAELAHVSRFGAVCQPGQKSNYLFQATLLSNLIPQAPGLNGWRSCIPARQKQTPEACREISRWYARVFQRVPPELRTFRNRTLKGCSDSLRALPGL